MRATGILVAGKESCRMRLWLGGERCSNQGQGDGWDSNYHRDRSYQGAGGMYGWIRCKKASRLMLQIAVIFL